MTALPSPPHSFPLPWLPTPVRLVRNAGEKRAGEAAIVPVNPALSADLPNVATVDVRFSPFSFFLFPFSINCTYLLNIHE